MHHVEGKANVVADCLTRSCCSSGAVDQATDHEVQALQLAEMGLVASKFDWRGLKKDVRNWVCIVCQSSKVQRHIKAPLVQFPLPERRFDHVNVDFVGPLTPSLGFSYVLAMVDRTTHWLCL